LLDPPAGRAVAGGNVETSQRVVDVLLGAFAGFGAPMPAASQGTMNNLTFGDGSFGYYETLGGGAGAGADHDGTSAVHTHMTNSRITDAEILETRAPVRVRSFSIRRGSGGAGRRRGGDGLVRELEATRPLDVALLAQRRIRAPSGLFGGAPGARGVDTIVRADGRREPLRDVAHLDVGDVVRIETPGGGGYGNVGNGSGGGGDGGDGERES
ncbi:hydantoinase B/oxoprolinase family protein, partial [Nodularia spumigena]|uniref:hydantoinase B/oxoprolinase family protein n=1 Tax=Nodularia spumigena TaxID=70799 RepID=UPI002B20079E